MVTMRLTFLECLQNSQELGSTDEHMVSRLFFSFEVNGHEYTGFYCDIKQMVGAQFESESPLEVGAPTGGRYPGPFPYEAFRAEAESYYRGLVGSQGRAIRIGPGAKGIGMINNRLVFRKVVEIPVSGTEAGW
jgi:hypothetical protein